MKGSKGRNVAILGILGILAVSAIAWFLVLSPRLAQADEISAQADQVETNNLLTRNRVNQAREQVKQAPAAAAEAQKLFATMPQAAELPTVLNQISDAAQRAGIGPANIAAISTSVPVAAGSPTGEASGVTMATMDIGISATGPSPNLMTFLDNLQGLDRALLITATQESTPPIGENSMEVQGRMFVLQSQLPDLVAQVDELMKQAEAATAPAPAGTSAGSSATTPATPGAQPSATTAQPSATPAG